MNITSSLQSLDTYLNYVSSVVPIIGDYLFRAVAPQRKAVGELPVTQEDIEESMKTDLNAEEKKALEQKLARE